MPISGMNNMRYIFIYMILVAVSFGSSVALPGGGAINSLKGASLRFQRDNAGEVPKSIKDLEPYLDMDRFQRKSDQYTWFESPVPFHSGKIIAITNHSILEDRRSSQGRYALYIDADDRVHSGWFPENDIAVSLETSGLEVPDDGLFVQPVTDWSKFPDYLNRMPDEQRDSFLRDVERKYKLTVRDAELIRLDSIKNEEDELIASSKEVLKETAFQTEETAEVVPVETSEEPIEKSSDWLLWLIGALIVVGGFGLATRRKS